MSKEAIAIKALEALARLGNGDQYGNSTGNVIARTALFEIAEQPAQPHMTTNLHDKMLAAIDALFSASDTVEEEVAENLLLDVRDEINKHKLAAESLTEGLRLDDWPKIGCVNHDCDQCKAQQEPQEPVAVVSGYYGGQCVILPINPARIFNSNTALYTAPQPPAQPLTDEQCDAIYTALDEWAKEFDPYEFGLPSHCGDGMVGGRAIIRKAAHGITKGNT